MTLIFRVFYLILSLAYYITPASAESLNIAVASNFSPTMKRIVSDFTETTGKPVNVLVGSTGKHHLQIMYGAPIHLFFAADSKRPAALVQQGKAQNLFNYAIGRLAFWIPNHQGGNKTFNPNLITSTKRISLANPKHAPYGLASQQTLMHLSLWDNPDAPLLYVFGENVNQSYTMVKSHAVNAGFVAYSQLRNNQTIKAEDYWLVPQEYYHPIKQAAVTVKHHSDTAIFLTFFQSPAIQNMIEASGYQLP